MFILEQVFFYGLLSFTALLAGGVAALLVVWVWEQIERSRLPRGGFSNVSEFFIGAAIGLFVLALLIPNVLATQSFRNSPANKWLALALAITGFLGLLGFVFREALFGRREPAPLSTVGPTLRHGSPADPPPLVARQPHACAAKLIEHPVCGLIVAVAVVGTDQSALVGFRGLVQEEVAQHRPRHLLVDLTGFTGGVDPLLTGALVSGLLAVQQVHRKQGTLSVVATGKVASDLERTLPVMKLYDLFGGRVHRDIPSALEQLAAMADTHA